MREARLSPVICIACALTVLQIASACAGGVPDSSEGNPSGRRPTAQAVAHRALCLGALIMRGEYEQTVQLVVPEASGAEAREVLLKSHRRLAAELSSWLSREGLTKHLSPTEKALLSRPLGRWSMQEMADASWRAESLGVLLWAISITPVLPPYDSDFAQPDVIKPLGLFRPISPFLKRAKLRPGVEIARAREIAELWHWRARTTQLQESGTKVKLPEGVDLARVVRESAEQARKQGLISRTVKGDFPFRNRPYSSLTDDEWSFANSIALERHFALNWLCGRPKDWDSTRTDT